jgi:dTDP-4-amino-4,6-dideoxygalactose transaminase
MAGMSRRTGRAGREAVRLALDKEDIEARPVWKPMHLQPVFRVVAQGRKLKAQSKAQNTYEVNVVGGTSRGQKSDVRGQEGKQRFQARMVGGKVSEDLFERGLCLPSGTAMTDEDLDRVINTILNCRFR